MGKLTDQVLVQAIRDSIAIDACEIALYHYAGEKRKIAASRFVSSYDTLTASVCRRLSEHSASTVRNQIKRIAADHGFRIHQYRKGASIRIHTTKEHSDVLEAKVKAWWEKFGYSQDELRPAVQNHSLPKSEAELLAVGGAA